MTVDNVSTLRFTTGSGTNNLVNLLGYTTPGDGGGGTFYWDSMAAITLDNGGTVFRGGASTGVWKRIYNGSVFMEWFGADPSGVADASAAIQSAINSFDRNGPGLVECNPTSKFAIQNAITVPYGISINFNNVTVTTLPGGDLDTLYMFYLNASKNGNTIKGFSGNFPSSIGNVTFDNSSNALEHAKIFYSRSKHYIYNIITDTVEVLYSRTGSNGEDYNDQIHINRVASRRVQNIATATHIDIGWLGDNLKIEDIELKGAKLHIAFCQGGVIDRILNADITIENCYGLTLSNGHIEHGNILIRNSVVKLSNIFQFYHYGNIPLTITSDTSSYQSMANKSCIIENYNVVYYEGETNLPSSYNADVFDAYINGNVIINNFFRCSSFGTQPYLTCTATRITLNGTASFDDYNSCASNSISSVIVNGRITATNQSINTGLPGSYFIAASGRDFQETLATYYKLIVLLGDTRCLLATRTSLGELSFDTVATPQAPNISNPSTRKGASFTLRLYRGTTSRSYDHYVDIPFTCFDELIDYGFYTNTGHYWQPRTAGPVDTFNTAATTSTFVQSADGTKVVKLAGAPTVGTWQVGDRIDKLTPDTTNIGWICTALPTTFIPITA